MPHEAHILFIGDSLIEFFDWQQEFPAHRVTNLGRAGETVEGLLSRLNRTCGQIGKADMIVLMTGTNNIGMEDYAFGPGYEEILKIFAEKFPKAERIATSLIPLRLPWLDETAVPRMNVLLRDLVLRQGATYLDLYQVFTSGRRNADDTCFARYYLDDGVHLSAQGYRAWAGILAPLIEETASSPG